MHIYVYIGQVHKEQKLAWQRSPLLTTFNVILTPREVDSWESKLHVGSFCAYKNISGFFFLLLHCSPGKSISKQNIKMRLNTPASIFYSLYKDM